MGKQPCAEHLRPGLRLVAVCEMSGAAKFVVCPGREAPRCGARECDWNEVIITRVDDQDGALHARSDAVESLRMNPHAGECSEFMNAAKARSGRALAAGDIAEVQGTMATVIRERGSDGTAISGKWEEAVGENESANLGRMRGRDLQCLDATE